MSKSKNCGGLAIRRSTTKIKIQIQTQNRIASILSRIRLMNVVKIGLSSNFVCKESHWGYNPNFAGVYFLFDFEKF